jgi:Putative Ig domain
MDQIGFDALRRLRIVLGASLALALCACGGDGSASSEDPGSSAPSTTNAGALAIQGVPPAGVNYGSPYSFTPTASGPSGATLAFSIQNKPSWAAFNSSTGALTGTPDAGDVGTDADIVISVSDGTANASLAPFSVSVNESSTGAATLNWTPVTETTSDTALTGLAGYIVYYGTSANNLNQQVKLANPGLTTYMVTNLAPATWYFGVAAYTSDGVIGEMSNVGEKTIP